jgi:hypothetical protein
MRKDALAGVCGRLAAIMTRPQQAMLKLTPNALGGLQQPVEGQAPAAKVVGSYPKGAVAGTSGARLFCSLTPRSGKLR